MAKEESRKPDFFIRNDSHELKAQIKALAKNKGLSYSPYVRTLLIEHVNSQPENKRIYRD